MNRHNLTRTIFGAALLFAFAACTQDEPTDGNGTSLPEGKYPLEIGSISLAAEVDEQPWRAGAPQTRVSENPDGNSSHWETGDVIYAKTDGAQEAGTFRIVDAQGSLTVQKPTYWTKTTENVTAWYPAEGTVELADQSNKLAYVLQAVAGNASYNQPIELGFTHQLAKVRVTLQGDQAKDVTDVKIKSYTTCTNTQGAVSTDGATEGWITMMETERNGATCWEANVVPDRVITAFQVNGVESTLDNGGITPLAAKVNTIELIVGKKVITGGATITQPGEYIISGRFNQTITLDADDVTLTLDNVSCEAYIPIKITQGTPTIKVKGTNNTLICKDGEGAGISLEKGAGVRIIGDGAEQSKLVVKATQGETDEASAGIGQSYGPDYTCGDIWIENVMLTVTGGKSNTGNAGGAAIGTNGVYGVSCGNITIKDAKIEAYPGPGAAAIGFGMVWWDGNNGSASHKIGNITIENTEIKAILTTWGTQAIDPWPAIIGLGTDSEGNYTVGDIRITTNNAGISPQDYFKECTYGTVMVGVTSSRFSYTINNGSGLAIYWNGVKQNGNIEK